MKHLQIAKKDADDLMVYVRNLEEENARLAAAEQTHARTITELREQLALAEDCINDLQFVNDGQRETIERLRGEIPDFKELGY